MGDATNDRSRVDAAGRIFDQALPTLEKLRIITQAWENLGLIKNGDKSIPKFGEPAQIAEQGFLQSQSSSDDDADGDFLKYSKQPQIASFVNIPPKRNRRDKGAKSTTWEEFKRLHSSFRTIKRPANSEQYRDPADTTSPKAKRSRSFTQGSASPTSPKDGPPAASDVLTTDESAVPEETITLTKALQESWEELQDKPSFVGRTPERLKAYLDVLRESSPEQLAKALEDFTVHGQKGLGQIESPRGYPLIMLVTFEDIQDSIARFKEARMLLTGMKDSFEEMPRHGFIPAEMIASNAIDLPSSIPQDQACSNLDDDIHPLFRIENFKENAHDIYTCLMPALRLASKLLTEPVVSLFWHTACFGKRDPDPKLPKSFDGHTARRIREPVHWTPEGEKRVKKLLDNLSDSLTFDFTSKFDYPVDRYAEHGILPAKWPLKPRKYSRIIFGQDTYTTAKKLAMLKMPDPMQVLRFHFLFAVILVHEIAHAIESRHKLASDGTTIEDGRCDNEAYYGDHEWCEAGRAWEKTVFHGTFLPINKRVDAAHGLCIYDYPDDALTNFHSVDMRYIWAIQRKETWQREDLSVVDFQVPRNGAVGTGSYFTPALFISDTAGDPHMQRIANSHQEQPSEDFEIMHDDSVSDVETAVSRKDPSD